MLPAACWGTVCLWMHRPIWKRMPVPSPPGCKIAVAGTPMDFTEEKTIGRDINADYPALKQCSGYDHCYVIADSGLRHTAWLTGPETGHRHGDPDPPSPACSCILPTSSSPPPPARMAHLTASIPPSAWKPRISLMPPTIPIPGYHRPARPPLQRNHSVPV